MIECNAEAFKRMLKRSNGVARMGYNNRYNNYRNDESEVIIIKDEDRRRDRDGLRDILPILLLTLLGNTNRNNVVAPIEIERSRSSISSLLPFLGQNTILG
jgi:hypothetical protein